MRRGRPRSPAQPPRSFRGVRELRGLDVVRLRLAAPLLFDEGLAPRGGLVALLRLESGEEVLVGGLLRIDGRREGELPRFLELRARSSAQALLGVMDRLGGRLQLLQAEGDDLVEEGRDDV